MIAGQGDLPRSALASSTSLAHFNSIVHIEAKHNVASSKISGALSWLV